MEIRIHELLNLESTKYEYKTVIASTKFIKYSITIIIFILHLILSNFLYIF